MYDLSKYDDWYDYNFKSLNKNVFKKNKKNTLVKTKNYNNYVTQKNIYLKKIYSKYNSFLKVFIKNYDSLYVFTFKYNVLDFLKVTFNKKWVSTLKNYFPI